MTDEVEEQATQTQADQAKTAEVPATAQPTSSDNSKPKESTADTDVAKIDPTQEKAPSERGASLELVIVDSKNHGIPNLALRVINVRETVSAPRTPENHASGFPNISGMRRFHGSRASTASTVCAAGKSRNTRRSQA